MPIKVQGTLLNEQLQLRQIGEIRIGEVVKMEGKDRRGNQKTRPSKLSKFRFTSASKPLLEDVAKLYGGEVRAWTPANGGPSKWEVYSETDRVPVLVYGRPTTQWWELNDGPRCVRVCDGETEKRSGKPCLCDPHGLLGWWDERECKPTTRLLVMLQDVPAIGHWLLKSKGRNAAEMLPSMAHFLAQTGGYVPGFLGIEEKITYPEGKPPNRFMVPFLEARITPLELLSGGASIQALSSGHMADPDQKAIAASSERPDWVQLAKDAPSADAAVQVYFAAKNAGEPDEVLDAVKTIGSAKRQAESALNTPSAVPGEQVDAEIIEDEDELDRLLAAISVHMPAGWDASRLNAEFASRNGGVVLTSGTATELGRYLEWLKDGTK